MKSGLVLGTAVLAAVTGVGCGPNLTAMPTPPSGPSTISTVLAPRIGGLWGGPVTLTGIAGGTGPARTAGALQCAGRELSNVIGESNDHILAISHQDPASTAITARLTSAGTGLACSYSGHIGANNTFVLDASSCDAPPLKLRCSEIIDDELVEQVVTLNLVGSSITGTYDGIVDVTALHGTAAHTYNVDAGDGGSGLVANHSFPVMVRR
jgi:hypothetical protein